MRALPLFIALLPSALWADDIPLTSKVSAVTLYPQGATITRNVPFTAPAGQHDLILLDLPRDTDLNSLRVEVEGATMGSVSARRDFVPPQDERKSEALAKAEAEVTRLEDALRVARADIQRTRLEQEAADARVAFLAQIGKGEGVAQMDVGALRDLVGMIGDETLAAKQSAHDVALRAEAAERDLKDLIEELARARQAVAALVPQKTDRALLSVSINSDVAVEGQVKITYLTQEAYWQPLYDVNLTRATGALSIERGALMAQNTGENWQDVGLTLSTVRPSDQTEPSQVWPELRRIFEPPKPMRNTAASSKFEMDSMGAVASAPMMEAPIVEQERASADFDGLAVTYSYARPVTMASGADDLRIALGELSTKADVYARAVPLYDETAFVMAKLTNDMGELILPGQSTFYLDGRYVGQMHTPTIAAGGEADFSFGPIDGVRLTRTVLDRQEGDSGVITKSSDMVEKVRIDIENLTGEAWPIRLLDRVPYSEQEDLTVKWSARPNPTAQDVDGKRGVMAWEFDLPAEQSQQISLTYTLQWPDGMILQ